MDLKPDFWMLYSLSLLSWILYSQLPQLACQQLTQRSLRNLFRYLLHFVVFHLDLVRQRWFVFWALGNNKLGYNSLSACAARCFRSCAEPKAGSERWKGLCSTRPVQWSGHPFVVIPEVLVSKNHSSSFQKPQLGGKWAFEPPAQPAMAI